MKKVAGLGIMTIAILWLIADFFWGLSRVNLLLVLPMALLLLGLILHIFLLKKESRY
jgi:uncharacterized membrane protein YqjE